MRSPSLCACVLVPLMRVVYAVIPIVASPRRAAGDDDDWQRRMLQQGV
jgi:hypothetical protein